MKKSNGSPEILKKSHAHKSNKDYSRKNKSDWLDEQLDIIGVDNSNVIKNKLKKQSIDGGK